MLGAETHLGVGDFGLAVRAAHPLELGLRGAALPLHVAQYVGVRRHRVRGGGDLALEHTAALRLRGLVAMRFGQIALELHVLRGRAGVLRVQGPPPFGELDLLAAQPFDRSRRRLLPLAALGDSNFDRRDIRGRRLGPRARGIEIGAARRDRLFACVSLHVERGQSLTDDLFLSLGRRRLGLERLDLVTDDLAPADALGSFHLQPLDILFRGHDLHRQRVGAVSERTDGIFRGGHGGDDLLTLRPDGDELHVGGIAGGAQLFDLAAAGEDLLFDRAIAATGNDP